MKKIIFGILIGFLFVLVGCSEDDGYSLHNQWIGFGVLQDTESNRIKMDNGDILKPVAYEHPKPWYDFHDSYDGIQDGDRILVNYTILDDEVNDAGDLLAYYVKINHAKEILMKGVIDITTEIEDSIGSDPIIVQDVWMANDLLNFKIKYWGRYETHFINLVKQPGELKPEDQPFELELRHNGNNDEEAIPFSAYVSFKLDSLQVAGLDSVQFKITCTDYDDEVFNYDGVYNYGENN